MRWMVFASHPYVCGCRMERERSKKGSVQRTEPTFIFSPSICLCVYVWFSVVHARADTIFRSMQGKDSQNINKKLMHYFFIVPRNTINVLAHLPIIQNMRHHIFSMILYTHVYKCTYQNIGSLWNEIWPRCSYEVKTLTKYLQPRQRHFFLDLFLFSSPSSPSPTRNDEREQRQRGQPQRKGREKYTKKKKRKKEKL